MATVSIPTAVCCIIREHYGKQSVYTIVEQLHYPRVVLSPLRMSTAIELCCPCI